MVRIWQDVVSETGVVEDFIVHDRPAGQASGCKSIPEAPQIEVIGSDQATGIDQAQQPTPGTSQGALSEWDAHEATQDAQSKPGRATTPLQCLSQTQQAPQRVETPMDDPEERERDLRHQELETRELELEGRSHSVPVLLSQSILQEPPRAPSETKRA